MLVHTLPTSPFYFLKILSKLVLFWLKNNCINEWGTICFTTCATSYTYYFFVVKASKFYSLTILKYTIISYGPHAVQWKVRIHSPLRLKFCTLRSIPNPPCAHSFLPQPLGSTILFSAFMGLTFQISHKIEVMHCLLRLSYFSWHNVLPIHSHCYR